MLYIINKFKRFKYIIFIFYNEKGCSILVHTRWRNLFFEQMLRMKVVAHTTTCVGIEIFNNRHTIACAITSEVTNNLQE